MKAIFRCELCGKEWSGFIADLNKEQAIEMTTKIVVSDTAMVYAPSWYPVDKEHPNHFYTSGLHGCDDGSVGLARFVGFKMEVEEENSAENHE